MAKDDKKKSKNSKKTEAPKKAKKSAKLTRSEKKSLKNERKKATKRDIKNMGFFERRRYKRKLRRDRRKRGQRRVALILRALPPGDRKPFIRLVMSQGQRPAPARR